MDSAHPESDQVGWIRTLGAIGAIALPLAVLFGLIIGDDSGDTAAELIAFAKGNSGEHWFQQIVALLTPLLIGFLVASLWAWLRQANEVFRALTLRNPLATCPGWADRRRALRDAPVLLLPGP